MSETDVYMVRTKGGKEVVGLFYGTLLQVVATLDEEVNPDACECTKLIEPGGIFLNVVSNEETLYRLIKVRESESLVEYLATFCHAPDAELEWIDLAPYLAQLYNTSL